MKTIKTRDKVKNIKILNKSANLSMRMKDSFVRTKDKAEETQDPRHASPAEYATDSIQDKAQGAAHEASRHLPNPRKKAQRSIDRAKGHFEEARRQRPEERKRAAEQAQKTAHKAKSEAEKLRNTADSAADTAKDAKSAVKDAKQTLREVRQSGRQTMREAKRRSAAKPQTAPSATKPDIPAHGGASQPGYLNKGVRAPSAGGNAANTVQSSAKSIKSTSKGFKETAKGTVKTAKKSVKTAEQTAKKAVKTAQQAAKTAQKTAHAASKAAKVAERAARAAAKAAVHATKAAARAVAAMVKAAIAAIKGLVAAIAAGGWIVVLIILIVCLIGLLVASIFGIFFSSEPSPGSGLTINGIISEIDGEYTAEINGIITSNSHDLLDMSGARAGWKGVLAVYTVRTTSDPDNPMEVATIDEEKADILRTVFWDMNSITHSLDSVDVEEDVLGDDGLPTGETETVSQSVLRIVVSHKAPEELAAEYGFSIEQMEQLEELLKPEYHHLWNALLYGITSIGDGSMIGVAETQLGNVGGEPYWSWYGFDSRVEWCACFVSWVAEQCGFIDAGIIPRFSGVSTGVQWFKDREQWQDNSYTPRAGDIIFFDWENDGICNHVGIVENVENGMVNTIEGNTSDSCARRSYELGSVKIYGYGVPAY